MTAKNANQVIPGNLVDFLQREGGALAVCYNPDISSDDKWTVAIQFGKEAEDSPMAAGAVAGIGETCSAAFSAMLGDLGEVPS